MQISAICEPSVLLPYTYNIVRLNPKVNLFFKKNSKKMRQQDEGGPADANGSEREGLLLILPYAER
jgi:hypothetical protein